MFSNGVLILVVSLFSFSLSLQADPLENNTITSGENDLFYLCKRDRVSRWLRAYRLENGKCKALYSKDGYLQVISSATYFASCEGVLLNVKKNLEEGRFKCTQISKASVIELEPNP